MKTPRIKICCIGNADEVKLAVEAGASAIGLVSDEMPSGPGTISAEQIARLSCDVPEGVETFLLTCRTRPEGIIDLVRPTRCTAVQICDALEDPESAYAQIRAALPSVKIVQVIHVEDELALDEAFRLQSHVDALLLDSGRPKAAAREGTVKELGGTGRAHDWMLSRRIVGIAKVPVWLAGGLNPSNVDEAVRDVGPYGLDVCSGVRTNGKLDSAKLKALIAAAAN
jgi:phosphoribosylanthranilate isomerase